MSSTFRENWLLNATMAVMLLVATSGSSAPPDRLAAARPGIPFGVDSASSGWITFESYKGTGIFFPAKIKGKQILVFLYGGSTNIDTSFAATVGLSPIPARSAATSNGPAPAAYDVTIELGNLALTVQAAGNAAPKQFTGLTGRAVPLQLGEEAFKQVAVDIDYAHHRLAFRDAQALTAPKGAVQVPLVELDSERVVPLSINGAPAAQFELELGNVSGPLLVTPAYAKAHKLLDGRRVSERLSGKFVEAVVTLDHLRFANVDFQHVPIALVPDAALPAPSITGGVGWPLLSHFHLIIDYPHNRLFALPNPDAANAPIIKDRLGLVVTRQGDALDVTFVSTNSPAAAAGFKVGDQIVSVDGSPAHDVPDRTILTLRFADSGETHSFAMRDGSVRRVIAADFF